jgi:O-antigen/teichoic acid export membrane protein
MPHYPLSTSARLRRNTVTLLVNNGGGALLSFALSVIIGRALGEGGLGMYAAALAWVYPLSLVAEFGLGTLITREVAQDRASAADWLRAAAAGRLLIGGALTIALLILAPLLTSTPTGLQISAPLIVIVPFVGVFTAVFRAYHVMWPVTWLNLGMLLAQMLLTALVLILGGGVLAALIVNVVTSAGQLIAAWIIYRIRFAPLAVGARHASPPPIALLLRRAAPFALAGVLAAVQLRVGVILLEVFTNPGEVGYYTAATRFIDAARMIPNALFGALLPVLSAQSQRLTPIMIGLLLYSVIVFGLIVLFAPFIIRLTFGEAFLPAAPALMVSALALLPSLLRSARTLYWYARGREAFVNRVTLVSVLAQIALSLWLIPLMGAVGVAGAVVLSEGIAFILLMLRQDAH